MPADGSYLVLSQTLSNDGDVSGNHGNFDLWLFELDFPGIPVLPEISITADNTVICPGQSVSFFAATVNGGDAPSFQWQVNGVNTGSNDDTITLSNLNNGDVVSSILTSNSRCVTEPTANSNNILITVDPTLNPSGFLFEDTAVCSYAPIDLKANGVFSTYLWNTNAVTPSIRISQPGEYWLQVTTATGCPGKDTVIVSPKECLKGFYIPTAFTPNNDGKNDLLKPVMGGSVVKYNFIIHNKWGQVIFQSTDPAKGWDGSFKGIPQTTDVFIWTCSYQFIGELAQIAKGTLVLIR